MTLQLGSRSEAVKQLQNNLKQLAAAGKLTLPKSDDFLSDGVFGVFTEKVVMAFQKAAKIEIDGVVGDQTLSKIDAMLAVNTPAGQPPVPAADQNTILDRFVAVVKTEVGTREVGGNNCGVRVREYQRASELRPLGDWPWCAAFVCWGSREWLAQPAVREALGWSEAQAESNRPKTASAFGLIEWARSAGQQVLPSSAKPKPGMIVVYEFSHTGIVVKDNGDGTFQAIEGNTNGQGARDSITGDGVWEKKRNKSLVRKFIAWNITTVPHPAALLAAPTPPVDGLPHTAGIGGIPREVLEFIIDEEGMDQPWKFPGGESGVSIGHGYDLGAETRAELLNEWKNWLSGDQLDRLSRAIGKSGDAARDLCPSYRDITITAAAADDVFYRFTLPKYYQQTMDTFQHADKLPGKAQGALLSIVYNRGTSLKGARRAEMRNIRDLLAGDPPYDLKAIAKEIREMKKIWIDKGLDGLIARREKEARWVEEA